MEKFLLGGIGSMNQVEFIGVDISTDITDLPVDDGWLNSVYSGLVPSIFVLKSFLVSLKFITPYLPLIISWKPRRGLRR